MNTGGPIFIGGLSHSGKTELRMILGAHPEICMTRRTRIWDRFYGRFGDLARAENLERCLGAMSEDVGVRLLQPDIARIRQEFHEGPPTYGRLIELVHRHHAERLDNRRWGEQLGLIERFADVIFDAMPSAQLIHMVRDPRARYAEASLASGPRRRGALGWDTALWLWSAELAARNSRRYPDRYLVVRFESLAADPEGTARRTCAFLGEQWTPQMSKVVDHIDFDSSGPESLMTSDASFVERYARRHLEALGYPSAPRAARRDPRHVLYLNWPINRAAMAARRVVAGNHKQWSGS